jgi:hypothetical protein
MAEAAKSIFRSKTFWSNVLLATAAVASGQFGVMLPATAAVPIVTGVNLILRFLTKGPVRVP